MGRADRKRQRERDYKRLQNETQGRHRLTKRSIESPNFVALFGAQNGVSGSVVN